MNHRRDNRVGNWRDFQVAPDAKKARISSYKEEKREGKKFGAHEGETWKKSWK